jgi:hypothetical protein
MLPDPRDVPLLTVDELVAATGRRLRRSAIYDGIRRGEVPSVRVGRKILIPTAAILRLFAFEPPNGNGAPEGTPSTEPVYPPTADQAGRREP